MNFDQPQQNEDFKSKRVEVKTKSNMLKEKARNIALAAGIGATAVGGLGYVAKDKYFTDYSDMPTKEEALKKAKEDQKTGFYYKKKYYDIKNLENRIKNNLEEK